MKNKLITLIHICSFICLSTICNAQTGWKWTRADKAGSEGTNCAIDGAGNVYGVGNHPNYMIFDNDTIYGAGFFLAKYDTSGYYKWALSSNTSSTTPPNIGGIATDRFGNEYLFGAALPGTFSFGSHILSITGTTGYGYYFITKVDSSGTVKWIKNLGNAGSMKGCSGKIAVNQVGDIFISCSFSNNIIWGSYSFLNTGVCSTFLDCTNDFFVAKLDSSGNPIWANHFGGNDDEMISGMSVTDAGNLYISGTFKSDSIRFGSNTLLNPFGWQHTHTFLTKFDNSGNVLWAIGSDNGTITNSGGIAANSNEDVFIVGDYVGSAVIFDGTGLPPSHNSSSGYLAKITSNGIFSWVKEFQGGLVSPYSIAVDPCDNVWVTIGLEQYNNADTIDGHIIIKPAKNVDPLVLAGWSSSGSYILGSVLASGGDDIASIVSDNHSNLYLVGDFEIDTFKIGPDTFYSPYLVEKSFLAKFNTGIYCKRQAELDQFNSNNLYINIYPNPANNELSIHISEQISDEVHLNLFDLEGRQLFSRQIVTENTIIPLTDVTTGIYFCRFEVSGKPTITKKLIILK